MSESDTWSEIQAIKNKQSSLREKLARRKKERQDVVDEITGAPSSSSLNISVPNTGGFLKVEPSAATVGAFAGSNTLAPVSTAVQSQGESRDYKEDIKSVEKIKLAPDVLAQAEKMLVNQLMDITLNLPVEVTVLFESIIKALDKNIPFHAVDDLIQKYAAQQLLSLSSVSNSKTGEEKTYVDTIDHSKLTALWELEGSKDNDQTSRKRKLEKDLLEDSAIKPAVKQMKKSDSKADQAIESLLSQQSAKERENKKLLAEIQDLLSKQTAKEQFLAEKFRSQGGAQLREFCSFGTKEECKRSNSNAQNCDKLHFNKIINKHTDESLGDCSFLNTCFHMDTCKYVHYEIDYSHNPLKPKSQDAVVTAKQNVTDSSTTLFPAQWVQCDLRSFNMEVLGKFAVVMADPPWDIHMELPYGTMSDDEMRKLNIPALQDDGYIFLWVTGRAMELGRECLTLWGYERVDELIWVKTNQLQRIIRTGRTGHWLNHGKEHCLVGAKGNLKNVNRGLDCDVIVAEVRATSHKPDEVYGIIERLSPGTRKIELFGRPHNVQPNWVTLGNQVDGVKLLDPEVVRAFKKHYPDGNCLKSS